MTIPMQVADMRRIWDQGHQSQRYEMSWSDRKGIFGADGDIGGSTENRRSTAAKRAWRVRKGLSPELTTEEIIVANLLRTWQ